MSEKDQAKYWLPLFCFLTIFSSCVSITNDYSGLPPGIWRGVLRLDQELPDASIVENDKQNIDFTELPFNFDVKYITPDSFIIEIINGDERIVVDDIKFGIDRKTAKDTVVINFPVYDTYIKALYEEGIMEGHWYVNYKENYSVPFKAFHGQDTRFKLTDKKPNPYIQGKWETSFDYDTKSPYPAIGQFQLDDSKVTGTFKTETGDYRYLEGQSAGDEMTLSCFDGSHAFLFESKLQADSSLIGTFYSGNHYTSNFVSRKNSDFNLTSVYNLTQAISDEPFYFELADLDSNIVRLTDPAFAGKAKIIQIMGTWCPNCRDETKFLKKFAENKPENIEVISVSFERYRDVGKAMQAIQRYKDKMDLPYTMLHGGYSNKAEASKVFPMLNKIISYPTLIFLNQHNQILKIHTGFNGPATDEFEAFKEDFNQMVSMLQSEMN